MKIKPKTIDGKQYVAFEDLEEIITFAKLEGFEASRAKTNGGGCSPKVLIYADKETYKKKLTTEKQIKKDVHYSTG